MKSIVFICHGNICRSVAAEYIAKEYLKAINRSHEFKIFSRAISKEEIGNDIYPSMKEALRRNNIPFSRHSATFISKKDYDEAYLIFYMDEENRYFLNRYFPNSEKVFNITMYSTDLEEIEDPYYSARFDLVVKQIQQCIKDIFSHI